MSDNIKRFLILLFVLFFGASISFADGSYKNELTKVGLSPIGKDDVKITLYMAKPYTEPLRLLKKNDGEFVLILPETYTSAPQKPSISDVIGEVTDADVKLYSFVSNSTQNGYTKIVIKTNGLINLYPEAVTSGGGTLVLNAQQEHHKIVSNQPQKQVQPNNTPKKVVENSVTQPLQPKVKEQPKNKVESKAPEIKTEELPVVNLPKIAEKTNIKDFEVPLEEVQVEEVSSTNIADENISKDEVISKRISNKNIFVIAKDKLIKSIRAKISYLKEKGLFGKGNLLVIFGAIFILGFALKFSKSVINSTKPQENDFIFDDEVAKTQNTDINNPEYSDFFKTLIEAEVKGDNPFTLDASKKDSFESDVTPIKSHEEVLNEDQNLTWQEKFRALQKNKKALLKEDEDTKPSMEITDNMNIENPIKKLTQDFKAVKKVLEKQKEKQKALNNEPQIEQEFTPEKIEKIEVISFEDFQKNVSKPKIQINNTTSPIKAKAPKILTQLQLGDNKGLYLVDYKDKISLVGYVNERVFKLNTCNNLRDAKLYARLTEKNNGNETYIVKFDNNKMLIDVNDEQMKLKLMY